MARRIHIGLIIPSSDTTAEPDLQMVAPADVTIHSHRLWLPEEGSGEKGMDQMNAGVADAARYLATAKVDAIAYGCTTGSFYRGPGWDTELIRLIENAAGVPATVTSHASVEALRFFGAKKISVATPYPELNNKRLWQYLEGSGFTVLNLEADPWAFEDTDRMIGDREPEDIADYATQACLTDADALFCSCTAWRSLEAVEELERRTGKPVVSANQATAWSVFRKLGITEPIHGFGKLLASLASVPT